SSESGAPGRAGPGQSRATPRQGDKLRRSPVKQWGRIYIIDNLRRSRKHGPHGTTITSVDGGRLVSRQQPRQPARGAVPPSGGPAAVSGAGVGSAGAIR